MSGWRLVEAREIKSAGRLKDGTPREVRGIYRGADGWTVRLTCAIGRGHTLRCIALTVDQDQDRARLEERVGELLQREDPERIAASLQRLGTAAQEALQARGIPDARMPDELPGRTFASVTASALRSLPVDDMATLLAAAATLAPAAEEPPIWRYDDLRHRWANVKRGKRSRTDTDRDTARVAEVRRAGAAQGEANLTAYAMDVLGWSRSKVQRLTRAARDSGLLTDDSDPKTDTRK